MRYGRVRRFAREIYQIFPRASTRVQLYSRIREIKKSRFAYLRKKKKMYL